MVAAEPKVVDLLGLAEDAGRGGFWGAAVSSIKAPGIDELEGRGGLDGGFAAEA